MTARLNMKGEKGFTLIEVLIVVVILGILAALFLPKLIAQPEKARVAEALPMLGTMMRGEEAYKTESGSYLAITGSSTTADWQKLGFDSNQGTGKYWAYTFVTADGTGATDCGSSSAAAIATRNATAGGNGTDTIKLCEGQPRVWKGTHPNKPSE